MIRGEDFRGAVRRGRRTVTSHAVVYRLPRTDLLGPRVGVVVSKQVGGAVVRNRIRRRIQAVCAEKLGELRDYDLIVVRALPGAHQVPWDTLRTEIGDGLRRAVMGS